MAASPTVVHRHRRLNMLRFAPMRWLLAACLVLAALVPPAQAASTYAKTKYPIVLVHGIFGFDSIFGIDYFYRVPADLRSNGAKVYVASLSPVDSSTARGEELLKQMQQWAARDGVKKFNIIAHSQGGVDARYVAGVAPSLVASVTTVASPTVLNVSANDSQGIGLLLADYPSLAQLLGTFVSWLSGSPELPENVAAAQQFAQEVDDFATRFPAGVPTTHCGQGKAYDDGVYFFSAAGNKPKTNALDPSDLLMTVQSQPGDGVFISCDTHLGTVLRDDYPWNHLDEINQLFGLIGAGAPDPVAFYRQQANRLTGLGL